MQNYKKLGLIFEPRTDIWWCSHYAGPSFVEIYPNEGIRVYFSGTSNERVSKIGHFTIDQNLNPDTVKINDVPMFDIGRPGCFDENGVAYPWIVDINEDVKYLYYVGWIKGGRGGFFCAVGLAISEDKGKTYKRVSEAPILERINEEPISTGSVCVRKEGNIFKMWYTCFDRWELINEKYTHFYKIRYAESSDGIIWKRNLSTAIDFYNSNENVIAKPHVIFENEKYKMWYSYRSLNTTYRIGYAESKNGVEWDRMDSVIGIDVGEKGEWDSEMIEYAHIFDLNNKRYILYNGNAYGKTGIGVARLI